MKPYVNDTDFRLYVGDVRKVLAELPAESVDCCVTSPPYWGLRDYGTDGQIGLEATPEQFVAEMVDVFREVRRVLAPHGTLWLNLGDSYNNRTKTRETSHQPALNDFQDDAWTDRASRGGVRMSITDGQIKEKDLVGIPWRVAFALQADGWYLRADIIWAKPNPMPESVTDRPTKSHEYVFLLTKQPRYFFDQEAIREPATYAGDQLGIVRGTKRRASANGRGAEASGNESPSRAYAVDALTPAGRNVRSVWEIATQPYPEAHFATFPEALPDRCIRAGCPTRVCRTCGKASERILQATGPDGRTAVMRNGKAYDDEGRPLMGDNMIDHGVRGSFNSGHVTLERSTLGWSDCGHNTWRPGVVLDPFMGSGTTALVARRHGRHAIGVELNPEYAELCARRTRQLSLLADAA